jgi:hypothetical protein
MVFLSGCIELFGKVEKFPRTVVEKVALEVLGLPKTCIESDFSMTFENNF